MPSIGFYLWLLLLAGLLCIQVVLDDYLYGSARDEPNLSKDANIADPECTTPVVVISSPCKEGTLCITSMNSPLYSTPSVRQKESSNWIQRQMNGLENFLGVSCEGFEQEASELFSTIKYNSKGYKGTLDSINKERGSRVKGVRELLNLACSLNYDSKRNLLKPLCGIGEWLVPHYESKLY